MEIATFRPHTASLHQAIRSTGCALAYKAHGCAVMGWFSTALIGAFRSSVFCMLVYCCSLGGQQSYSSPVVVFFDRGHPCFRNFNSTVPVDIIRVKSYVNRLFDPACVPVRVTINKLYLIPRFMMSQAKQHWCNRPRVRTNYEHAVLFLHPTWPCSQFRTASARHHCLTNYSR